MVQNLQMAYFATLHNLYLAWCFTTFLMSFNLIQRYLRKNNNPPCVVKKLRNSNQKQEVRFDGLRSKMYAYQTVDDYICPQRGTNVTKEEKGISTPALRRVTERSLLKVPVWNKQ